MALTEVVNEALDARLRVLMHYNVVFPGIGKRKDRNNTIPRQVSPTILFLTIHHDLDIDLTVECTLSGEVAGPFTPKVTNHQTTCFLVLVWY